LLCSRFAPNREAQDLLHQQDGVSKSNTGKKDIILATTDVSRQGIFTANKEITTLTASPSYDIGKSIKALCFERFLWI